MWRETEIKFHTATTQHSASSSRLSSIVVVPVVVVVVASAQATGKRKIMKLLCVFACLEFFSHH